MRISDWSSDVCSSDLRYNYGSWPYSQEEWPGISVFFRNEANEVFHTYSTYGRGVEVMMGAYAMLDLMPKGRDERDVEHKMEWVRHHDRYESDSAAPAAGGRSEGRRVGKGGVRRGKT